MNSSTPVLDQYANEARDYMNKLAGSLGAPDEMLRVMIIWKAVMHTIRERIPVTESFALLSDLPVLLKGIYVTNWKYSEQPLSNYDDKEEMKAQVKSFQEEYGEEDFNWEMSTEDIVSTVLGSLEVYVSRDVMNRIKQQIPEEVR